MKNLKITLVTLVFLALTSCSLSKPNKIVRKSLNGSWTLNSVHFEGTEGKIKAKLFNEADTECFVGSQWTFNQNNSFGNYSLTGNTDCPSVQQYIIWSINEVGSDAYFQFKKVDQKKNPTEGNSGYRLKVIYLDDTRLTAHMIMSFEGKPLTIVHEFSRN